MDFEKFWKFATMDEEDYKQKREKNNQSVKKCRLNEKRKIEMATEKLEQYKKEHKMLDDKYSSLQKELSVLKSLFFESSSSVGETSKENSADQATKRQKVTEESDKSESAPQDLFDLIETTKSTWINITKNQSMSVKNLF